MKKEIGEELETCENVASTLHVYMKKSVYNNPTNFSGVSIKEGV